MEVTNEDCARRGRSSWGFPKIVRKITLERGKNKYVGTSYLSDSQTVELKLILEVKKTQLNTEEKNFIDFVSPLLTFIIKGEKVLTWGGSKYKIYERGKVALQIWKVKFGQCSIELANDPKNIFYRLNLGKIIVAYWYKQRYQYMLTPQ